MPYHRPRHRSLTPNTLYAATSGEGLFKSTDGGATWDATGLSVRYVIALAIDPATPATLYAAGEFQGVFKSTDSGATWSPTGLRDEASSPGVHRLVIDPGTPSTLYALSSRGVFRSVDAGATWGTVDEGLPIGVTALASGIVEGNLLADNHELATLVTGGSAVHPATVLIDANRAARNGAHGLTFLTSGYVNGGNVALGTDPGQNTLALLEPLQTVFDRNDPDHLRNIPDTLTVTLSDNDASDNFHTGIRFGQIFPDFDYRTVDETQPLTSRLTANLVGNTSAGNGYYGVIIEGGSTNRAEARQFIQTVAASFEGNSFAGNGRAGALFTFTYWRVSAGLNPPIFHKFAEASTYEVTDADGELAGFDYDHPATDELAAGTVLDNTLTVNGVEVPHGTRITPESAEISPTSRSRTLMHSRARQPDANPVTRR